MGSNGGGQPNRASVDFETERALTDELRRILNNAAGIIDRLRALDCHVSVNFVRSTNETTTVLDCSKTTRF